MPDEPQLAPRERDLLKPNVALLVFWTKQSKV